MQAFSISGERSMNSAMVENTTPGLQPKRVFLFSGHMIDAPGRAEPRFPPDKEVVAILAINNSLDQLEAGPQDLAFCSGACGGDILFAEACLKRGMRLELRLPFDIPDFLERSVIFAGAEWRARFHSIKNNPLTNLKILPEEAEQFCGENPYARTNRWLIDSSFARGEDKVHFICLWNRQRGDAPGGTEQMYDEVSKRSGQVHVLDTTRLFEDCMQAARDQTTKAYKPLVDE